MKSILEPGLKEWQSFLESCGEKPFRARQILEWVYQKQAGSFEEMTSLPKTLRDALARKFFFLALEREEVLVSQIEKGTSKILYRTADGWGVEAVLLPNSLGKHTLCLSTQVGCPLACSFCATGQNGFVRNLSVPEILFPVYEALKSIALSNIVFMGMGEPLLNPELGTVLERLTGSGYFNLASRSVIVSTVGIPEGILKMREFPQVKIAWSYHSSRPELRKELFPVFSERYPLETVIGAFEEYQKHVKRRMTVEYLLLGGINTGQEEALALKKLSRRLFFYLNLIPYNPHPFSNYRIPSVEEIRRFAGFFENTGIEVTVRASRGADIQGACGQLAGKIRKGRDS